MSSGVYSGDFVTRPEMPQPATALPKAETDAPIMGGDVMKYALDDHQHPRADSATTQTTGADGRATITFTRAYPSKPAGEPGAQEVTDPVFVCHESWIMTGANYTGCVLRAYKSVTQALASVTILGISATLGGITVTPYAVAPGVLVSFTANAKSV